MKKNWFGEAQLTEGKWESNHRYPKLKWFNPGEWGVDSPSGDRQINQATLLEKKMRGIATKVC